MEEKPKNIISSWTAPEFIRYEKTRTWFIVLGAITVGLLVTAILTKNYFFALLILISSFLVYIHAQKHPRKITIKITDEEIEIGNNFSLSHKEILSFWIFEDSEIKTLSLETKKILRPKITLLLENTKTNEIKESLLRFIKEKKHEESIPDIIARKLKF
ncbi:MAG TPA: hypothetical protein P5089_03605 [Candidatus Portnoybacteria bacterium]|nr:hypothetical protein [Candidatus Portnoybacteria bacterium]